VQVNIRTETLNQRLEVLTRHSDPMNPRCPAKSARWQKLALR
jgi:hypothetical protein